MYFNYLLDATLGPRKVFEITECSVCGFEEVYYTDPKTNKCIGRACANCQSIQVFNFEKNKKSKNY